MNYIIKYIDKFFQTFDFLGTPVTMSYKKQNTFKTCFGGTCSLIAVIIIGAYIFGKTYFLLDSPNYNSDLSMIYLQPYENTDSWLLNKD